MRSYLDSARSSARRALQTPARGITNVEFVMIAFVLVILSIPAILLISNTVSESYTDVATEVDGTGSGYGPFPDTVDTADFETDANSDGGVAFNLTYTADGVVPTWPTGGHMYTSGSGVESGRWSIPSDHQVDVTMFGFDIGGGAGFRVCRFEDATGGSGDCTTLAAFSPTGAGALVSSPAGPAGYDWLGIVFDGESRYDDVIVTNVGP